MTLKCRAIHEYEIPPSGNSKIYTLRKKEFSDFLKIDLREIESKKFPVNVKFFLKQTLEALVAFEIKSHEEMIFKGNILLLYPKLNAIITSLQSSSKSEEVVHHLKLAFEVFNFFPLQKNDLNHFLSEEAIQQLEGIYDKMQQLVIEKLAYLFNLEETGLALLKMDKTDDFGLFFMCIYREESQWKAQMGFIASDATSTTMRVNSSYQQYILIDSQLNIVENKFVSINARWDYLNHQKHFQYPPLIVSFNFYNGIPRPNSKESNMQVFQLDLQLGNPLESQKREIHFNRVSRARYLWDVMVEKENRKLESELEENEIPSHFNESTDEFENAEERTKIPEWVAKFIIELESMIIERAKESYPNLFSFDVHFPESDADWKYAEKEFYRFLLQDIEKNAPVILWITEKMIPTLPPEQVDKLVQNAQVISEDENSLEVEPKLESVLNVLIEEVQKEESQNQSSSHSAINPSLLQEDALRKQQIIGKTQKPNFSFEKNKRRRASSQAKVTHEQIRPQNKKKISLNETEKKQVRSIFEGHPMKVDAFNKLVLSLLKKKMSGEMPNLQEQTHGSHPVLRFKKADGTRTGLTLWRKHGDHDGVSSIHSQKRTLKDLFES